MRGTSIAMLAAMKDALGRQEEHLVGLEAEFRSLGGNDATRAGPRGSMLDAPTSRIANPTTDNANGPDRPASMELSASGTELQPLPRLFPWPSRQTDLEGSAASRPSSFGSRFSQISTESSGESGLSIFGKTITQNATESNAAPTPSLFASRPSLFDPTLRCSNATTSIFGSESAPRPDFSILGTPLTSDARPRQSVPSFTYRRPYVHVAAQTSESLENNTQNPSPTATTTGFNILSGELPFTARNRVLSKRMSVPNSAPLPFLTSEQLSFEQPEKFHTAELREGLEKHSEHLTWL